MLGPNRDRTARPSRRLARVAAVEVLERRQVMSASTTTTFLHLPPTSASDRDVLLIAGVSGPSVSVGEGTVTFRDGSAVLGTVALNEGSAALRIASLPVGTHRISATYDGSADFLPSRSGVTGYSTIRTVAGTGTAGNSGDGGPATSAPLTDPTNMVVDRAGNLYFTSTATPGAEPGRVVRKVNPDGTISTIAGTGTRGNSGDGGPAISAQFLDPMGLAVDASGNLFIADYGGGVVRKVATDGTISTVIGTGVPGYSGDGGPGASAQIGNPYALTLDAAGNLYVSDPMVGVVRKLTPAGTISTVAGNGNPGFFGNNIPATSARLSNPLGLAVDAAGSLFIADTGNAVIRKVTPDGIISTIAGSGSRGSGYDGFSGPATNAQLSNPQGLAFDADGTLYFADTGNNVIRRVLSDGTISSVTTITSPAYVGDGRPAYEAQFNLPTDLSFDPAGNLYIADRNDHAIRKIDDALTLNVYAAPVAYRITGLRTSVTAGTTYTVTVTAVDVEGRTVVDYDRSVKIFSSDPRADVPYLPLPIYTAANFLTAGDLVGGTVMMRRGVGTFEVTFKTAGRQTLSVADGADPAPTAVAAEVDVAPAAAGRFAVVAAPGVSGAPVSVTVTALDDFGNVAAGYSGTVQVAANDPSIPASAGMPLVAGVGRFTLTLGSASSVSFIAADVANPLLMGSSEAVTVTAPVRGVVFRDDDADGILDAGEAGLPGRTLYLDLDGDGSPGPDEPTAITAADGSFRFPGFAQGTVPILEPIQPGGPPPIVVTRVQADGSTAMGVVPSSSLAPVPVIVDPVGSPIPDANAEYVRALYRSVLGREGSVYEVGTWVGGMANGLTRPEVASAFVNAIEHREQQVASFYRSFLHRDTDPAARAWVERLMAGTPESAVAAAILDSPEYRALHPDDDSFVRNLYRDVLGREADAVGLADKTTALAGGTARASVVAGLLAAPEVVDQVLDGLYSAYLRRRRDPTSAYWAEIFDDQGGSTSAIAVGLLASDEFYAAGSASPPPILQD